ncbi:MAG: thioredoxin family protein [Candidatus Binatia bacterium]|nr:thioredoxin family protein [Candidatus Binatia bacterium]
MQDYACCACTNFVRALRQVLLAVALPLIAVAADIVELSVRSVAPNAIRGGSVPLEVQVRIAPGWHIHGHEADEPFLIPTELSFELPEGAHVGPIRYPLAESRSFAFAPTKVLKVYQGTVRIGSTLTVDKEFAGSEVPVSARLRYQACTDTTCAPPKTVTAQLVLPVADRQEAGVGGATFSSAATPGPDFSTWFSERGRLTTLLLTLLLGLGLNLTPCVYPLISITVAFFGRQAASNAYRRALLAAAYVSGIVASFVALGVAVALSGGMFGAWLQRPPVLIGFAALMMLLAGSSFGLYQFRLPSVLTRRAGGAMPGLLGALAMGASMGLVAAPCVGPVVVGLLLFVGQKGDPWLGVQLFAALGTGLGLPYLLLAFLASSLHALPRSGDWLVWMERLFGFVLVAAAVYFVAPLLPRRAVHLTYAAVALGAAVVLGVVPLAHAHRWFRWFQRVVGASLLGVALWLALPSDAGSMIEWEEYSELALEQAVRDGKPVLIDFVADWCIPCHEMEATTFADRRVAELAERFVMLRADVTLDTEKTKAMTERFRVLGVPTIVLLDPEGREVQRLVGYVTAEELALAMGKLAPRAAGAEPSAS